MLRLIKQVFFAFVDAFRVSQYVTWFIYGVTHGNCRLVRLEISWVLSSLCWLTHFVSRHQSLDFICVEVTRENVELVQCSLEFAERLVRSVMCTNLGHITPVRTESICFLWICLFIFSDSFPVDIYGSFSWTRVVCACNVNPAVGKDDSFGGSSVNSFVVVSLEETDLE